MLTSLKVITGGITLNPIVLGTLTTAGILLKSYHEFKNIKSKTDLLKCSLREAMIHDLKILDLEILDLLLPSYKFGKKYAKKFASGE